MNRALLLLALCAVATAFAPGAGVARSATRVASSTRNLDSMVGGDVETGGAWDPLGFSQIGDYSEKYGDGIKGLGDGVFPHVKWLREAEIKHGRICMLAFMGIWGYSVLGPLKGAFGADTFYNGAFYEAVPWDQAIASATKTNPVGMIQVIAVIAIIEGHFFSGDFWGGAGDREAGDQGLRWMSPKRDIEKMKLSELKNGRLAMIGMASLGAAYAVPGSVPLLTSTMPNL